MCIMELMSRHQCLIYQGAPSQQLPALASLLQQKLGENYRCLYLNSPPMVAGMRSYLASTGSDVAQEVAKTNLVLSSETGVSSDGSFDADLMMHKLEDALDQALKDGYKGLFATGDMTWEFGGSKDKDSFNKLLEYEWRLEKLFRKRPELSGVCQYHSDTLPAQEIEDYVEKVLRQNIGDTKELSRILEINHHMNQESLKEHALKILLVPTDKIIKQIVQKITVHKDSLTIKLKPAELALLLSEEGKEPLQNNSSQEIYTMTVPFQVTKSAWKGAVVIRPPAQNSPEDIFSLPPHELRDLVRGIVWRDQHFSGMTIREIAKQTGQSDVFVGRLIRNTLKIA